MSSSMGMRSPLRNEICSACSTRTPTASHTYGSTTTKRLNPTPVGRSPAGSAPWIEPHLMSMAWTGEFPSWHAASSCRSRFSSTPSLASNTRSRTSSASCMPNSSTTSKIPSARIATRWCGTPMPTPNSWHGVGMKSIGWPESGQGSAATTINVVCRTTTCIGSSGQRQVTLETGERWILPTSLFDRPLERIRPRMPRT